MLKWLLIALASAGALSAFILAQESVSDKPTPELLRAPVRNPFAHSITGAGLVEPASESITIGVSDPGIVEKIFVSEGQRVNVNDPLFKLTTRSLEAELVGARAAVVSAEAELDRIIANGRKEEEAVLRAKLLEANAGVQEAEQNLLQAQALITEREWVMKDNQQRAERLELAVKGNASPEEQLDRAKFSIKIAEAQRDAAKNNADVARARINSAKARAIQVQADLDKFVAGAWEPEVKKARAAVGEAKAKVERLNVEIDRRTVRSPLAASVLRLNLRPGEYVQATSSLPESAPIVLGDLSCKHVRVDIDEFDAQRLKPQQHALAYTKGRDARSVPLEFVRVEPFIVPKRAVTNSQREIVDTRVLQVVYRIAAPADDVYVGQQMDVFVEN